jgi:hypothetical protein
VFNWLYTSEGHLDLKWIVATTIAGGAAAGTVYREFAAWRERRTAITVELNLSTVAMFPDGPRWQVQVWVATTVAAM